MKKNKHLLKVITKNIPGKLDGISKILAEAKINIKEFTALGIEERGLIILHTSDQSKASKLLQDHGYYILEENGMLLKLENRPGALAKITNLLLKHNININSAATLDKNKEYAYIALTVDNTEKAQHILKEYLV